MVRHGMIQQGQFMGPTLFEHGIGQQGIFLDSSHLLTLAMTGAGKSITSIWPQLCIGDYSGYFVISPKPEHARFAAMRHADPALFEIGARRPRNALSLGLDPRKAKNTRYHFPGSRAFVLDPGGQTEWPTHRYTFLSDVDPKDPRAPGRLMAIASGSIPDNPNARDPWFTNAPKSALAGTFGNLITTPRPEREKTLPNALRLLMGVDPETGVASPKRQQAYLQEMMRNPALGGRIQIAASAVYQLGEKAFGALNSELQTRCEWMLDKRMERILSGPSDFSLEEVGVDRWPVSVFAIPPRGEQAANAWLRTLFEAGSLIWQQRKRVPKRPVLLIADELKLWGSEVGTLRDLLAVIRDANVRTWSYAQNYPQLVQMYGESGAQEMVSACSLQVFGCNDQATRRMIRERLGKTTLRRCRDGVREHAVVDLVSDDAIERELSISSALQYVLPTYLPPIRAGRMAHKPIVTKEGLRLPGLPLAGHYEEGVEPEDDEDD